MHVLNIMHMSKLILKRKKSYKPKNAGGRGWVAGIAR